MAADPTELLKALGREVRGVRGGVVLNPDGSVLAEHWLDAQAGPGRGIALCAGLVEQLQHLAAEAELGRPRRLSLRGERGQLVIGRSRRGLTVGIAASPATLGGQLRRHLEHLLSALDPARPEEAAGGARPQDGQA
jgi:predicted regulator of Ras-like GTPase activity (Roadblock/LC7/MglB family)